MIPAAIAVEERVAATRRSLVKWTILKYRVTQRDQVQCLLFWDVRMNEEVEEVRTENAHRAILIVLQSMARTVSKVGFATPREIQTSALSPQLRVE